jgi:hypothetical protein
MSTYTAFLDHKAQSTDGDGFAPVFLPDFLFDFLAMAWRW